MKATNAERINWPIQDTPRVESRADAMTFRARWQTAVETVSGHALQKLRLELAHSVSGITSHLNAWEQ
jgi:hypothetical protein